MLISRTVNPFICVTAILTFFCSAIYGDEVRCKQLMEAGAQAMGRSDYAEAAKAFEAAVKEAKQLGPENLFLGNTLFALGTAYYGQNRFEEAWPLLSQGLAIGENRLGTNNTHVADAMNTLAVMYIACKKYPEAENLLSRALFAQEKIAGKEDPNVARILSNIVEIYYSQGKYLKAKSLCERILLIDEHAFGPNDVHVANDCISYADVLRKMGRQSDAVKYEAKARTIKNHQQ